MDLISLMFIVAGTTLLILTTAELTITILKRNKKKWKKKII